MSVSRMILQAYFGRVEFPMLSGPEPIKPIAVILSGNDEGTPNYPRLRPIKIGFI